LKFMRNWQPFTPVLLNFTHGGILNSSFSILPLGNHFL
jgi:hypothetical protein